ncbi:MAG TPA: hypothetical protein VHG70_02400 [Nocardioidaceae bacterium]|nr:hypothetical protein [Nocardioidaceae bacterium]
MVDHARLERLQRKHCPELYPSRAELLRSLLSGSSGRFDAALEAAQRAGEDGESALVEAYEHVARARRQFVVEALVWSSAGSAEADALVRRVALHASGAGALDLRVIAMRAVTARTPATAREVLVDILRRDRNGHLKECALHCLAAVGDATAVPEATARLCAQFRRPTSSVEGRITVLAYLGQSVAPRSDQMDSILQTVRQHWAALYPPIETDWVARHWPDLDPGGPAAGRVRPPSPEVLRRWARSTLMVPSSTAE